MPAQPDSVCEPQPTTAQHDSSRYGSENGDGGIADLLALLGEEDYEVLEVSPHSGARRLATPIDARNFRTRRTPLIIRRKAAQKTLAQLQDMPQFPNGTPHVADGEVDQLDYEKRFRPDEKGKEKESNARVWRVYLNEAAQFDVNMIETMRDTVDVILISAALFSAVIVTLVALTATALQLDHPQVTNMLLMELIALQRAAITSGSVDQVDSSPLNADSPPSSTADITDYWINGLWFTSLAFSIATALLAILVRQWIHAYEAPSFQGTPKARAEVRHFRYRGIETWHVPLIIGLLPSMLHLSLFLFFAGLVVFLSTLNPTIAWIVFAITFGTLFAYVVTNLLPVWFISCPYKTPLSQYTFSIVRSCKAGYNWIWEDVAAQDDTGHKIVAQTRWSSWFKTSDALDSNTRTTKVRRILRVILAVVYVPIGIVIFLPRHLIGVGCAVPPVGRHALNTFLTFFFEPLWLPSSSFSGSKSLKELETETIKDEGSDLHRHMFTWLMQTTPNPSARSIVIPCLPADPEHLLAIQPPRTTVAEWTAIAQQSLSTYVMAHTTSVTRETFAQFATLEGFPTLDNALLDALSSARQYCKTSGISFLGGETYNLSSHIAQPEHFASRIGEGFLHRLCLHAFYHATPVSSSELYSLISIDLKHLYPAMRLISVGVEAAPEASERLLAWLPSPDQVDSLSNVTAPKLHLLLEVTRFMFRVHVAGSVTGLKDAFMNSGCLVFWRRMFDRHTDLFTQGVVEDALQRVIGGYVSYHAYSTARLSHIYNHLDFICLCAALRPVDELPWHIGHLVESDPWNEGWQEVQASLLASLPSEKSKVNGIEFLRKLDTALSEWRTRKPCDDSEAPSLIEADFSNYENAEPEHRASDLPPTSLPPLQPHGRTLNASSIRAEDSTTVDDQASERSSTSNSSPAASVSARYASSFEEQVPNPNRTSSAAMLEHSVSVGPSFLTDARARLHTTSRALLQLRHQSGGENEEPIPSGGPVNRHGSPVGSERV